MAPERQVEVHEVFLDDALRLSGEHAKVIFTDEEVKALVNGSVYGSDATPIAGNAAEGRDSGTMFRLSLLSAPTFPDPRTDRVSICRAFPRLKEG